MIGTDDLLACFVAGNVFTQEYALTPTLLTPSLLTISTATGFA